MATYINGVTGYIPQIQAFKPDFNFYNKALQMKQSKYDAAHEQMSNLYGSLLNAPMLRDGNIEARDQFFKAIDQDINKLSGMDLSLQQNVDAGGELFNQLLDNKNIVKDMVWTRNWQNEQQRAEGFRDCIDPEKCGGSWWEGGVQALNFQAEEFKNATDDQAAGMGNVRFTPYQDMMADAIKLAKEADLNITVDQLQGGYITTTKNGPQLTGPLANLFMGKFAKDPKYLDYYKTKSYVDRKQWIQGNVETYGSVEGAEQAYVQEMTNMFTGVTQTAEEQINTQVNQTGGQRKQLEERIRTEGTTAGSPLARQYKELNNVEGALVESQSVIKDANGNLKNVANRKGGSPRAAFGNIDNALAMMYMGQDINSAAQTLAYKDYEFSMKEDPYSFEGYKQANRLSLENTKHRNRMELAEYKDYLKGESEQKQAMGGIGDNVGTVITDVMGGEDVPDWMTGHQDEKNLLGDQSGYDMFQDERNLLLNDVVGGEKMIFSEALKLTQEKSRNENSTGAATQDLVALGDYLINESGKDLEGGGYNVERWNNATTEEKAQMAQTFDFNSLLQGGTLPNQVVSNAYENVLLPMMDMTDESNRVNKDYLGNLWATTSGPNGARTRIAAKKVSLDQLDKWYAKESVDIINRVSADNAMYGEMLKHYIDTETGRVRSMEEFATSYADANAEEYVDYSGGQPQYNSGWDDAYYKAQAMYRGDKQLDPGFGSYVGSGVDAIGTTVAGITGEVANVFEAIGGWVGLGDGAEWGYGWGSEEAGWSNWDYDSPTDVANWAAGTNDGRADQGLHDIYKRAFTKYATPEGGLQALGITGTGSKQANGINFFMVDPSKYKSSSTMNTMNFFKDAFRAGPNGAKITIGGPQNNLPENTDAMAKQLFGQVMLDFSTMGDAKNKKRPMLDVTYQNIAGSDDNWTAMNVKLNSTYIDSHMGSEKNAGLMRPYKEQLMNQGMTIYLNKNYATNGFYQASQNTDIDRVMAYAGEYSLDSHPGYSQNLKVKKTQQGGYEVQGSVMAAIDDQGQPIWQPHYNIYQSPLTDVNQIVQDYQVLMQEIALGNQTLMTQYNMMNGIKDPSQL